MKNVFIFLLATVVIVLSGLLALPQREDDRGRVGPPDGSEPEGMLSLHSTGDSRVPQEEEGEGDQHRLPCSLCRVLDGLGLFGFKGRHRSLHAGSGR